MSILNDFSALTVLGWKPLFLQSLTPAELTDYVIGRITEVERDQYRVQTCSGEYLARLPGRFHYRANDDSDYPTVGDWVTLSGCEATGTTLIQRLLPRCSTLSRGGLEAATERQLLCANVDTALIVSSLNQEFNLRRLERYITLVRGAGVSVLVVLTKADLCDAPEALLELTRSRLRLAAVVALNTLQDDARALLAPWLLAGDTLAVLGSSGVGKSTLINNLAGRPLQQTQAVRTADAKGRHTTTRRSLFQLSGGVCVIDTPGMRELKLTADENALDAGFTDIQALIGQCYFSDCSHQSEPGCAVVAALADGTLQADRWRNYQRLAGEQRQQSQQAEAIHERRERAKSFARMVKQAKRGKKQRHEY